MEHPFTQIILDVLKEQFGANGKTVFELSPLLQYINIKTRSANKGSKSRGSFANLYAAYVLIEEYVKGEYYQNQTYAQSDGSVFTTLLARMRQLPFGSKLQNHALNHRMNEEFKKYFPRCEFVPIMRSSEKYWINENLLKVEIGEQAFNIAPAVLKIIEAYMTAKRQSFNDFIDMCHQLKVIEDTQSGDVEKFILSLLEPSKDARVFEIVSYAVLKHFYFPQTVYFGTDLENLSQEQLHLYKTGRTNANDGGIDFVMRPLGRFFQVTETLDVKKYFLDIDKIERYPISFVIKSSEDGATLVKRLRDGAKLQFGVDAVVEKYMACIEEVINIPNLKNCFSQVSSQGNAVLVLDEIIKQSKVEFNYEEDIETADEPDEGE